MSHQKTNNWTGLLRPLVWIIACMRLSKALIFDDIIRRRWKPPSSFVLEIMIVDMLRYKNGLSHMAKYEFSST
jgi:hypothetical protein